MNDDDVYIADHQEEYEGGDDLDIEGIGEVDEDGEGGGKGEDTSAELEAMRSKLRQMEEEAAKLREMQAKVSGETSAPPSEAADNAAREEIDARSCYIGNVDYGCTPEELQMHFQNCGTVNRVTILTDKFGNPKGFAFVEFLEVDAVANAVLLDNSELRGRQIKVTQKRTNVPGFKQRGRGGRGGGRGGYGGYGGYGGWGYGPPPPYYGGGRGFYGPPRGRGAPRGRGRGRFFSPY